MAYDSFFTNPARGLGEVGCWTHGRRHVYQARNLEPARMSAVLAYIAQLYAVEKRPGVLAFAVRTCDLLSERVSRPVITQFHGHLLIISEDLLPKSELGQAVAYLLKNWTALTRYLEDGGLAIGKVEKTMIAAAHERRPACEHIVDCSRRLGLPR